jgi:GNAT superfamily N-acetyltransferase
MWEEDRDPLLENPDAPIDQITEGRTIGAWWDAVLPRDDGEAELNGFFVKLKLWRKGIGRRLIEDAGELAATGGAFPLFVVANPRAMEF